MALLLSILIGCILAHAASVHSSRWLVDQERLSNGENLIYAVFGEGPSFVAKGLATLLTDLQMSLDYDDATVLCIDVQTTSSVDSLRQIQKAIKNKNNRVSRHSTGADNGSGAMSHLLLVLHNVDRLHSSTELLNLDFLFRLPDKTFESGSVVTALVWDTTQMQRNARSCSEGVDRADAVPGMADDTHGALDAAETESDSESDSERRGRADSACSRDSTTPQFWTQPNAQHVWRDAVRAQWSAEGRGFNADAVLGRVSSALFFPAAGAGAASGRAAPTAAETGSAVEVEAGVSGSTSSPSSSSTDTLCALINAAAAATLHASTCPGSARHVGGAIDSLGNPCGAVTTPLPPWLQIRRSVILRYTLIFLLLFLFAIFFRRALTSVVEETPEQVEYTKHVRSVRKSRRLASRTPEGEGEGEGEGKGDGTASESGKCY